MKIEELKKELLKNKKTSILDNINIYIQTEWFKFKIRVKKLTL